MVAVQFITIGLKAAGMITKSRLTGQPLDRVVGLVFGSLDPDKLCIVAILVVLSDMMQHVNSFHRLVPLTVSHY